MKLLIFVIAACLSLGAHAYTADELRADCQAAEEAHDAGVTAGQSQPGRADRCMGYIMGFVDGYAVSDHLATKIGVSLNALCFPRDADLPYRLLRSVRMHLDRTPPKSTISTATLIAAALSKSFPCADLLEPKK